jgi:hypothetical protein
MKLDANDQVCGFAAKELRDFFRRSDCVTSQELTRHFGLNESAAKDRLTQLVSEGLIEPEKGRGNTPTVYVKTTKGNAIANVSFGPRMSRAKADSLLKDICARAEEVNLSDSFIHRVEKIWVFGSYTTEAPDLGDLDLVVEDRFKAELGDRNEVLADYIANSGRQLRGILDRLAYPTQEVLRHLKKRSRHISFHDKSQLELLKVTPVLLFDASASGD